MVVRHRKKSRRRLGRRFKACHSKRRRGKGSRGGYGRAGFGKRAAHRKTYMLRYEPEALGKVGFKSVKQRHGLKARAITLQELEKLYLKSKEEVLDLTKLGIRKVICKGKLSIPIKIKVERISDKARQRIIQAGGEVYEI